MLRNFVQETCNAPGATVAVPLLGAAPDRLAFLTAFGAGLPCFYFMDDGSQAEWGICNSLTASPATLTRDVVLGNTAGTLAKLNFAGPTFVYNDIPATHALYTDNSNSLVLPALLTVAGVAQLNGGVTTTNLTATGSLTAGGGGSFASTLGVSGVQRLPGGSIIASGSVAITTNSTGDGNVIFGTAFPTGCYFALAANGDPSAYSGTISAYGSAVAASFAFHASIGGTPFANSAVRITYIAFGH